MSNRRRIQFILLTTLIVLGAALQVGVAQTPASKPPSKQVNLTGGWRVVLILGGVKKSLIFKSRPRGFGSFELMDSGPDQKTATNSLPAVWSRTGNNGVSFTGDAELPLGTCCVEKGTAVFKGRFESKDSIAGKVVFVTSIDEEESPYKLRSVIGTFTAVRMVNRQPRSSRR